MMYANPLQRYETENKLRFDDILFHKDGLASTWLDSIVLDYWGERNLFPFILPFNQLSNQH